MTHRSSHFFAAALPLLLLSVPANAQCGVAWAPGFPAAGPKGVVHAVLPLPSGEIIAGGSFTVADNSFAANIARWDGLAWRPMTAGANQQVLCLARLPNGDVVAGGTFTSMGNQACSYIARWNGAVWSPIGTGLNGGVRALLVLPNGDLIAGGGFSAAGAVTARFVARWDGASWSSLGAGFQVGTAVAAMAQWPNGDLAVAGDSLGGTPSGVFRWNGTGWHNLDLFDPFTYPSISALAVRPNGDLALAGSFVLGGSERRVAVWNGATTQALLPPFDALAPRLLTAANGDLCFAGSGSPFAGSGSGDVARWNGTSWSTLGAPATQLVALAEDANARLVVGAVPIAGREHAVSRFSASGWQPIGAPLPPVVQAVIRMRDDAVVVAGEFLAFAGVPANHLARWNGAAWSPLAAGVDGRVSGLALAPNGDLIAAGAFANAGGASANRIARWNGTAWSTLGTGLPAEALAIAVAPNGEVWALLNSGRLWRFQGAQWTTIQSPALLGSSLACLQNGDIAIGSVASSVIWSNLLLHTPSSGAFTAVPGGPDSIRRLMVDAEGTLFAAGFGGLRSWNGSSWTTLLGGPVFAIDRLPNGDLLAGGDPQAFGGAIASGLYRRRGNVWENFGVLDGGAVTSLATTDRGEVFASGSFVATNGAVANGFAAAAPTCPAVTQIIGTGCTGGAGPVQLSAVNRPWVGGTLRSIATGMTGNSLAVQLIGLPAAAAPLSGGAAGCSLFLQSLFATTLLPAGGVVEAQFPVPPSPSLAGVSFRQQIVGVELAAAGIVQLTSSNALQLLIGLL
jgi:trimeric autotransporter adhesin